MNDTWGVIVIFFDIFMFSFQAGDSTRAGKGMEGARAAEDLSGPIRTQVLCTAPFTDYLIQCLQTLEAGDFITEEG